MYISPPVRGQIQCEIWWVRAAVVNVKWFRVLTHTSEFLIWRDAAAHELNALRAFDFRCGKRDGRRRVTSGSCLPPPPLLSLAAPAFSKAVSEPGTATAEQGRGAAESGAGHQQR